VREGEFTTEKTCNEIHDNIVRYCQGITGGGFSFRGLARLGRLGGLSLPIGGEWGRVFFSGFPPILSRCSPLGMVRSRCLALCAYSVGSPIPTWHPTNQSPSYGRISGQSAIRSGYGDGMVRQARTNYQCGRVDGTHGERSSGTA
jgi:hypothetical protein